MNKIYYRTSIEVIDNHKLICLSNWEENIFAYHLRREKNYNYLSSIEGLQKSHIYLLIGKSINENGDIKTGVYVGQANVRRHNNAVLGRVAEHVNDDGWETIWTDAMIFTHAMRLGESELNYLENRIYQLLVDIGKCVIWNRERPISGHPDEGTINSLEATIDVWKDMCLLSGFELFETAKGDSVIDNVSMLPSQKTYIENDGTAYPISFYSCKSRFGCEATIAQIEHYYSTKGTRAPKDYFVLLKGSRICPDIGYTDADAPIIKAARKYVERYCIDSDYYVTENIPFKSATTISSVIKGRHSSSKNGWQLTSKSNFCNEIKDIIDNEFLYAQENEINAVAYCKNNQFVILKGSKISNQVDYKNSQQDLTYKRLRESLIEQGVISDNRFVSDYAFTSRSQAEGVIKGKRTAITWRPYCEFDYDDIRRQR